MNLLLRPSTPGADFIFAFSVDLSSSSIDNGRSYDVISVSVKKEFWTIGLFTTSAPKKSSMQFS